MLFPQLYVSYSLIRNDSEKIFKSHLLWSFKAVPQNECIVRTSTNQSESCWKKIEKFKCWNFTIFPRLHGITLEKRSNNTYTLKVQVRFTWSSGRTLDFIPLGPVFENRYIQALASFFSLYRARPVAQKTLAVKKRRYINHFTHSLTDSLPAFNSPRLQLVKPLIVEDLIPLVSTMYTVWIV